MGFANGGHVFWRLISMREHMLKLKISSRTWLVGFSLAALVVAIQPGIVEAKKPKTPKPPTETTPPPAAEMPATQPTTPDNSANTAAQQELKTANVALAAVVKKANDDFQASDAYMQAKKDVAAAQSAYDAAATPVLERVESDPAYAQAMAQNKSAKEQIQALRSSGDPPADEIAPLAKQELTSGATARRLKSDALLMDSNVASAKEKLTAAQTALTTLRTEFQKTLPTTPEYTSAKQAVDEAKAKLNPSSTAVAK
jgi:hypothetical protein